MDRKSGAGMSSRLIVVTATYRAATVVVANSPMRRKVRSNVALRPRWY
jgi:hypothetical protein